MLSGRPPKGGILTPAEGKHKSVRAIDDLLLKLVLAFLSKA
jgi:hypothetical protein